MSVPEGAVRDAIEKKLAAIQDPEEQARARARHNDFSWYTNTPLALIPINVKQFAYTMMGGRGDLSENDLTQRELDELTRISDQVMADGRSDITYDDYGTGTMKDVSPSTFTGKELENFKNGKFSVQVGNKSYYYDQLQKEHPGLLTEKMTPLEFINNLTKTNYNLKTFIGGAQIVDENGNKVVKDQYNFNAHGIPRKEYIKRAIKSVIKLDPYGVARNVAGVVGPHEGSGSEIKINMGTPEYIEKRLKELENT